jgi:hypothetical protein
VRHRLPHAQLLEEGGVTGGERVDTRVESLGGGGRTLMRDERDRQPAQRTRDAGADRTAADDDEIVLPRVYNRASIRGELAQLVRAAES